MRYMAVFIIVLIGCQKNTVEPPLPKFVGEEKVTVIGYTDHLMEPFLSRDGSMLFFNNSNDPAANTNLHWATRVNDVTFEYKGELAGVNTSSLEGVASMDENGVLYFVSTRSYTQTFSSIYRSDFSNGTVSNVAIVEGISKNIAGWLNFDVEISATGQTMYFVDGRFDANGGPYEADLAIAANSLVGFKRLTNSNEILQHVNTDNLEYAACISADNLELYFTRIIAPITTSSTSEIFVATRAKIADPFGIPSKIETITGFVEAATISTDGSLLYYHKNDGIKFSLYVTRRIK